MYTKKYPSTKSIQIVEFKTKYINLWIFPEKNK